MKTSKTKRAHLCYLGVFITNYVTESIFHLSFSLISFSLSLSLSQFYPPKLTIDHCIYCDLWYRFNPPFLRLIHSFSLGFLSSFSVVALPANLWQELYKKLTIDCFYLCNIPLDFCQNVLILIVKVKQI